MNGEKIIEVLTQQFGGKLWEKHGHRRIYFGGADIARRQGLDWGSYNTGNISSAYLNGKKISNSECKRILQALNGIDGFKLWYDLSEGKFYSRGELGNVCATDMKVQFVADAKAAIGL